MSFKKYKGPDKYHFRVYKKSIGHPFVVATVSQTVDEKGEVLISGYLVTHSLERVFSKPGSYKRMKTNPNPRDTGPSFLNKYRITDIPSKCFSKPYNSWHLSKEDESYIDYLESKFKK